MSDKLLPCPLCGAHAGAKAGGPKLMVSDSGHGWTVRCTGCLARGPNVFTKEAASATWNTRPTPTQAVISDELRAAVIAAYIAGATDVHNNWQEDRDPDFTEAAHDYASQALAKEGGR